MAQTKQGDEWMAWHKHRTDDEWSKRNKNTSPDESQMRKTKALLLRIIRWADKAKTNKTGQDYLLTDEFKKDLHTAVVNDNWMNSKIGLSPVEKKQCNILWKKYSILGRLCNEENYPTKLDSRNESRT